MTSQEASTTSVDRPESHTPDKPFVPSMTPGPDDRRRSYGRRIGDRFPGRAPNHTVELAKGIAAMAGAIFVVTVLFMVAVWLLISMF